MKLKKKFIVFSIILALLIITSTSVLAQFESIGDTLGGLADIGKQYANNDNFALVLDFVLVMGFSVVIIREILKEKWKGAAKNIAWIFGIGFGFGLVTIELSQGFRLWRTPYVLIPLAIVVFEVFAARDENFRNTMRPLRLGIILILIGRALSFFGASGLFNMPDLVAVGAILSIAGVIAAIVGAFQVVGGVFTGAGTGALNAGTGLANAGSNFLDAGRNLVNNIRGGGRSGDVDPESATRLAALRTLIQQYTTAFRGQYRPSLRQICSVNNAFVLTLGGGPPPANPNPPMTPAQWIAAGGTAPTFPGPGTGARNRHPRLNNGGGELYTTANSHRDQLNELETRTNETIAEILTNFAALNAEQVDDYLDLLTDFYNRLADVAALELNFNNALWNAQPL